MIDSPASLGWKHTSGRVGYLDAALTPGLYSDERTYSADERVEITGTKGVVHITSCSGFPVEAPPLIVVKDGRAEAHTDLETDWIVSFTNSAHDFVNAILEQRLPHLTGERGRDVTAFALAAREAGVRNCTVKPEVVDVRGGALP